MRKSSILLLAIACISVAAYAADKESPEQCTLKRIGVIELDISPDGGIRVPVALDGTEAWMMLQTSTALTLLTDSAVTALGLKREPVNDSTITINGLPLSQKITLQSFMLGEIDYKRTVLAVHPLKGDGQPPIEMGRPVVGHLGINAFSGADFELDISRRKLTLFSQDHCPGNVVYWTKEYTEMRYKQDELGVIVFPMELDGEHIEATLATNYPLSTIDSNVTKKVYGFDEGSPDVTRELNANGRGESRFKAMALSAPGLNVANTKVKLVAGNKGCGYTRRKIADVTAYGYSNCIGGMPLLLGMNVLSQLRIYVATREKVIYVSRADAT